MIAIWFSLLALSIEEISEIQAINIWWTKKNPTYFVPQIGDYGYALRSFDRFSNGCRCARDDFVEALQRQYNFWQTQGFRCAWGFLIRQKTTINDGQPKDGWQ